MVLSPIVADIFLELNQHKSIRFTLKIDSYIHFLSWKFYSLVIQIVNQSIGNPPTRRGIFMPTTVII